VRSRIAAVALSALAGLGVWTASASGARVVNGDFERGNLTGWEEDSAGGGDWELYEGPYFPPVRRGLAILPAPPQGDFGVVSEQGDPGRMILSQVVKLKANRKHRLRFKLAYFNFNTPKGRGPGADGFFTPNHLRFGSAARPQQQFRMDVMKPGAPITSLKNNHVLENVYITERGDPDRRRNYRAVSANLSDYAGERVRLRFAVAVTEARLNVGIDAVKIKTKRSR
jgi:hypothetical protein